MADPTGDVNLLSKALEWAWAGIIVLGGIVYKSQNEKIQAIATEMNTQRQNVEKIFDKLDDNKQRAEDRHHELLTALHVGLDRKADK